MNLAEREGLIRELMIAYGLSRKNITLMCYKYNWDKKIIQCNLI